MDNNPVSPSGNQNIVPNTSKAHSISKYMPLIGLIFLIIAVILGIFVVSMNKNESTNNPNQSQINTTPTIIEQTRQEYIQKYSNITGDSSLDQNLREANSQFESINSDISTLDLSLNEQPADLNE